LGKGKGEGRRGKRRGGMEWKDPLVYVVALLAFLFHRCIIPRRLKIFKTVNLFFKRINRSHVHVHCD
jgi:hypothetical protein